MKKIIMGMNTVLLLLIITVTATHLTTNKYNLKTYSENIDWKYCIDQFDRIPYQYWEGVNRIEVYDDRSATIRGRYYYGSAVIVIDEIECSIDIIQHELAHHKQWMVNRSLYNMIHHTGSFYPYLNEIRNATNTQWLSNITILHNSSWVIDCSDCMLNVTCECNEWR